jgi:1-acyl-sn-glycerol-3-phosphate acyltransferase
LNTDRSLTWKLLQIVARVLTTQVFDLKVYGQHNIPASGGVLIVSNHQSNLDPVLLAVRLARPLNYIGKSELFEGRIGGWFLRRVVNAFPVRQGAGDIGAIRETIQRLREGHLLNIYPEGERTPDGRIGRMERGVGLIVHRARVPVVPVAIVGSFEAWPRDRRWLKGWPIRIGYGPPINLDGMEEDEIVATIDRTLREMFAQLNSCPDSRRRPAHLHQPSEV